jgi:hypothetical protein
VVSGVSLSTATGAAATAGTHPITATGGTAANYAITDVDGTLTVGKAALTYVATPVTFNLGQPWPMLTGIVTGFVNGDTLFTATTGALVFGSQVTVIGPAGSYAINGSGLSAANYTFVQAPGNATALTIASYPFGQPTTSFARVVAQFFSGAGENGIFMQEGPWFFDPPFSDEFIPFDTPNQTPHPVRHQGAHFYVAGGSPVGWLAFASSFTVPDQGGFN